MHNQRQSRRNILPYVGGALVALFFIGGIGASLVWYYSQPSNGGAAQSASKASSSTESTLTEADRQLLERDFPKKMLVHNQQAIELIDIELERGQSPALRKAATELKQKRLDELADIKALLTEWNESYQNLEDFPQQMGHDLYPTYEGMATLDELAQLRNIKESSVDKLFLDLMITHVNGSSRLAIDNTDYTFSEKSKQLVKSIKQTRDDESGMLDGHLSQHSTTGSHH